MREKKKKRKSSYNAKPDKKDKDFHNKLNEANHLAMAVWKQSREFGIFWLQFLRFYIKEKNHKSESQSIKGLKKYSEMKNIS